MIMDNSNAINEKFYFTYGTSASMPFVGGWTEVIAPNEHLAREAFVAVHPLTENGCLNCSFVYNEEKFRGTMMYKQNSNMGYACHETIKMSLTVEKE